MNRLLHYHWRCGHFAILRTPTSCSNWRMRLSKEGWPQIAGMKKWHPLPLELKSPFQGWTVPVNSLGKQRMQAIFANSSCTFQSPFQSTCKSINPFTLHHRAAIRPDWSEPWVFPFVSTCPKLTFAISIQAPCHDVCFITTSTSPHNMHITKILPVLVKATWPKLDTNRLEGLKAWTTEGLQQQPKRSKAWRKRSNKDWMQSCGMNKDTSSPFFKSFECRLKVSNSSFANRLKMTSKGRPWPLWNQSCREENIRKP